MMMEKKFWEFVSEIRIELVCTNQKQVPNIREGFFVVYFGFFLAIQTAHFLTKKVHELMHSFGAKHDPEASLEPECTPQDKVGTL